MAPDSPANQNSFLQRAGRHARLGRAATPHLWMIFTQPDPQIYECVIVSVTTLRDSKDQTVILRTGDHPFIRHDSTIFYGDAMIVDARRLDSEMAAGLARCGRDDRR